MSFTESVDSQETIDEVTSRINTFSEIFLEEEFDDKSKISLLLVESLNYSNLQSIEISGKNGYRLNDTHISSLVYAIQRSFIRLLHLRLKHHRISDLGLVQICKLVLTADGTNSEGDLDLVTLDLEGNDIGQTGCYALHECLSPTKGPECILQELNLSWNPLGTAGGIALSDALQNNSTLRRLFLANCDFTLKAVIALATAMSANNTLEILDIDRPLLTTKQEEDMDHLGRIIGHQNSLASLSLRYHHITDYGIMMLTKALYSNESLTYLNLECNNICVGGANAVSALLVQVPRLQVLKLSANKLGDEGACGLAEALKVNNSLHEVTLKHNNIGTQGIMAVGHALQSNNTLQLLSLWGNNFDDVSASLYGTLMRTRFKYTGLAVDFEVYEVSGVHMVAERDF